MTPHTSEHIDSVKTYALVLLALLGLTVLTTLVAFVDLGNFSVVVALLIAVCKMLLVALFFMHVRYSTRLTRLVILGGLFNVMAPVLWVIAVIGNLTVVHRIWYTYQQTRERDLASIAASAQPVEQISAHR